MTMNLFSMLLMALVSLNGCASQSAYRLTSSELPQHYPVVEGEEAATLVSNKENSDVLLRAYRIPTGELEVDLEIGNHSNDPISFDASQIRIYETKKFNRGKSLKRYNAESYAKKNRWRASQKGFAVDVAEGVLMIGGAAASAVLPGAGQLVGVAQQVVTGPASHYIRKENKTEEQWGDFIVGKMIKSAVIPPSSKHTGIVLSEACGTDQYEVHVPVGKDAHIFSLEKKASGDADRGPGKTALIQ